MNATTQNAGLLAGRLTASRGMRALFVRLVLIAAGAALLTIAAKIKVPFYPVPMTLQTLAIFTLAASLGPRLGLAAVLLYVGEGLLGLPVFTNTPPQLAGPLYVMGPTGGYLLGFALAAIIIGMAAERGLDRHILRFAAVLLVADIVVMACGAAWLVVGIGMPLARAFDVGVLPFLPGEAVKIALAALIMPAIWRLLGRVAP